MTLILLLYTNKNDVIHGIKQEILMAASSTPPPPAAYYSAIGFRALGDFNEGDSVFLKRHSGFWNYGKIVEAHYKTDPETGEKLRRCFIGFLEKKTGPPIFKKIDADNIAYVLFEESPIAEEIRKVKNTPDAPPYAYIRITAEKMERLFAESTKLD